MDYLISYRDQCEQWGETTIFAYSEEAAETIFSLANPDCTVLTVEEL
jgi:hypothetical protein